jgi:hypothetical protein
MAQGLLMPGIDDPRRHAEELKRSLLVAELLRHTLAVGAPKQHWRPWWQVILESSGGTALITVIIGGIVAGTVGQYLTFRYQQSLRQREVATATYEAYLKRADETLTHSLSLIGQVMSASENLIQLSNPWWNPERYPVAARSEIEAQRAESFKTFRATTNTWERERNQQTLLLQYYHNANPDVTNAWKKLQQSVSSYSICANRLYWQRGIKETSPLWIDSCIGERVVLLTNIDGFTLARLAAARKQALSAQED